MPTTRAPTSRSARSTTSATRTLLTTFQIFLIGPLVFYGTVLSPVRLQNTATRSWPSLVQV